MRIELAPMEGITNYIYRQALQRHFPGVDRFYTPFLTPTQNKVFTTREWKEINPDHNRDLHVVPQLLARNAEHFIWACQQLRSLGYEEVNLNLGCPSGTVVSKKKGSGFLSIPRELDYFLYDVFEQAELRISIKTRIGIQDEEEFPALLDIFNDYSIHRLIVHPRLRTDYYKGTVRMDAFRYAVSHSVNPVCYNGDLFSAEDIRRLSAQFPQLDTVMLGRGIISNPALPQEYKDIATRDTQRLLDFHNDLYSSYRATLSGEKSILCRMKELWFYQLPLFSNWEQYIKPLRKANHLSDYEALISRLFREEQLTGSSFHPY